jgi:hypothetical protein
MNPYLRSAARLRAQAALKLQARLDEEVIERARDDQGRFIEDDPSTPDIDEDWIIPKSKE